MRGLGKLKSMASRIRAELRFYRAVMGHPRTPRLARWLLGLAIAYLLSPVDLIPDCIPVLGYLDDVVVVPLLVVLALRLVPADVLAECRTQYGADAGAASAESSAVADP